MQRFFQTCPITNVEIAEAVRVWHSCDPRLQSKRVAVVIILLQNCILQNCAFCWCGLTQEPWRQ